MRKLLMLIGALITCNAYGEDVQWLNNDGAGNFSKNTCTTGGNISRPADPTKSGYQFKGWKNVTATYNLATLSTNIIGTATKTNGTLWSTVFSFGTIYGNSACTVTAGTTTCGNGTASVSTSITNDGGAHCWCKVLAYSNNNDGYTPTASPKWIYAARFNGNYCPDNCANNCANLLSGTRFVENNGLPAQSCRKTFFGVQ